MHLDQPLGARPPHLHRQIPPNLFPARRKLPDELAADRDTLIERDLLPCLLSYHRRVEV